MVLQSINVFFCQVEFFYYYLITARDEEVLKAFIIMQMTRCIAHKHVANYKVSKSRELETAAFKVLR